MAQTPTPEQHTWGSSARTTRFGDSSLSALDVTFETSIDEAYLAALNARHPSVQAVARWFRADHLPQEALHGDVAREFQAFTLRLLDLIGNDSVETTVALHKLLEAKDAAVRAAMSQRPAPPTP